MMCFAHFGALRQLHIAVHDLYCCHWVHFGTSDGTHFGVRRRLGETAETAICAIVAGQKSRGRRKRLFHRFSSFVGVDDGELCCRR